MSSESIFPSPPTSSDEVGSFDDVSLYDYELPEELIAKEPLPQRDASRLLVLDRHTGEIQHRGIRDLADLLRPGDCLVLNDTRVLPARLIGQRAKTGGKWEGLYLGQAENGDWLLPDDDHNGPQSKANTLRVQRECRAQLELLK